MFLMCPSNICLPATVPRLPALSGRSRIVLEVVSLFKRYRGQRPLQHLKSQRYVTRGISVLVFYK